MVPRALHLSQGWRDGAEVLLASVQGEGHARATHKGGAYVPRARVPYHSCGATRASGTRAITGLLLQIMCWGGGAASDHSASGATDG